MALDWDVKVGVLEIALVQGIFELFEHGLGLRPVGGVICGPGDWNPHLVDLGNDEAEGRLCPAGVVAWWVGEGFVDVLVVDVGGEVGVAAEFLLDDCEAVVFGHAGVGGIQVPPESAPELAFERVELEVSAVAVEADGLGSADS